MFDGALFGESWARFCALERTAGPSADAIDDRLELIELDARAPDRLTTVWPR